MHPDVALRTCQECQKWWYKSDGKIETDRRSGKESPLLRPAGSKPPCHDCPKIPAGVDPCPENAQELTEMNWKAFTHYLRCRAVRRWPKDALVEQHAMIIRSVFDIRDRSENFEVLSMLAAVGSKPEAGE